MDDYSCFCKNPEISSFVDKSLRHIVTSDLNIVKNTSLKLLLRHRTKYRVAYYKNVNHTPKLLKINVDKIINKTVCFCSNPIESFNECRYHFNSYLHKELSTLYICKNKYHTLKTEIKNLQDHILITYVDTCLNNIAFICKKYIVFCLEDHLVHNNIIKCCTNNYLTMNKLILPLHKILNFAPSNLNYPYIVLIPKFHKNSVCFRTVPVVFCTYSNLASKKLLLILNTIRDVFRNNHSTLFFT